MASRRSARLRTADPPATAPVSHEQTRRPRLRGKAAGEPPSATAPMQARQRSNSHESIDVTDRPDQRGRRKAQQQAYKRNVLASDLRTPLQGVGQDIRATKETTATNSAIRQRHAGVTESNIAGREPYINSTPIENQQLNRSSRSVAQASNLSGTATDVSHGTDPSVESNGFDVREAIERLAPLWDYSKKLTQLLAPSNLNEQRYEQLVRDISNEESRLSKSRSRCASEFNIIVDTFQTGRFIDTTATVLRIARASQAGDTHEISERHRADEIFHMANLATLLHDEVSFGGSKISLDTLNFLNRDFPESFSSDFDLGMDQASYNSEMLEMSVLLRIELFKASIANKSKSKDWAPHFRRLFYLNDDQSLKGFGNNPLTASDAGTDQIEKVMLLVDSVQRIVQNGQENDVVGLLANIEEAFPSDKFVHQLLIWAWRRARELKLSFEKRFPGDVEELQEGLDALLSSSQIARRTEHTLAEDVPVHPSARSSLASRRQKIDRTKSRSNTNPDWSDKNSYGQLSRAMNKSPSKISVELPPRDQASSAYMPGQPKYVEPSASAEEPEGTHVSAQDSTSQRNATRSMPEKAKPGRFIDTQVDAVKVPGISESQYQIDYDDDAYVPPNGQDDEDGEGGEGEEETEGDEAEEDDDAFQPDHRFKGKQRPAKRVADLENGSTSQAPAKKARTSHPARQTAVRDSEQPQESPSSATPAGEHEITLAEILRKTRGKQTTRAQVRQPQRRRTRQPYSVEEDQAIFDGMKKHGGAPQPWMTILEGNEDLFKRRTNVDLKDRASNLLFQLLDAGTRWDDLPEGMQFVTLRAVHISKLWANGRDLPPGIEMDDMEGNGDP